MEESDINQNENSGSSACGSDDVTTTTIIENEESTETEIISSKTENENKDENEKDIENGNIQEAEDFESTTITIDNLESIQLNDKNEINNNSNDGNNKVEQRQSMWIGSQPSARKEREPKISPLNTRQASNQDLNSSTSSTNSINSINESTTTSTTTTPTTPRNILGKSTSNENLQCNNSTAVSTSTTSSTATTTPTATSSITSWWNGLSSKLRTSPTPPSSNTPNLTSTPSTSTTTTTSSSTTTNTPTQFIPTLLNNPLEQQEEVEDQIFTHSAIDSATKIIREGYLNKQGHLRKNWLCRYFILTETSLEYYKDKGSAFLNRIPLADCTITMAEIEIKKSLCFKITHHPTKRPFYLFSNDKANTVEYERDSYEWIGSIQEVIDSLVNQQQQQLQQQLQESNLDGTTGGGGLTGTSSIVTESHKNYELVHCMSHALLFSLGKISAAQMTDLCIEDFQSSETFNINKEVSIPVSSTQPSLSSSPLPDSNIPSTTTTTTVVKSQFSYKFTDYSPKVFRKIRELNNMNSADYMISLTQNTLTEEPSQGKSSSLFYFTSDKKLLIKTITSAEYDQLKSILPNYYFHLLQNPDSLIVKFYGLHHISPSKMKNTFFVVMDNIFTDIQMDEIYDLKGSTLQRKAQEGKRVLMDLDFNKRIFISSEMKAKFLKQVESDCSFLEKNSSMDYSLLLGIHYLRGEKLKVNEKEITDTTQPLFKREMGGMLARTDSGDVYDKVYYVGIIDILTVYNIKKQIEHTYKAVAYDTLEMSAVNPSFYSKRFISFIKKVTGWIINNNNNNNNNTNTN